MSTKRVLVLGGNFAGVNAAVAIKHELHGDIDVTVVSKDDRFVFNPSLIWLPFGKRKPKDLTLRLDPIFDRQGIEFVNAEATKIDTGGKKVETTSGTFDYDYLVIATGYKVDYDIAPGVHENTATISTLPDAIEAGRDWKRFVADPGPVVVGATQGAACFGAAYEYLFNLAYQLKKLKLHKRVPVTFVTSEPFLGQFGIGGLPHGESLLGLFLRQLHIEAVTEVGVESADPGVLHLSNGRDLAFEHAMLMPPFRGADVVVESGLGDAKGFVPVRDTYQHVDHPDVYAAGVAVAVTPPWQSALGVGVPKTGFPTDTMARVAAHNISNQVQGLDPDKEESFGEIPAICVMDAGNNGVIILSDRMLPPRKHAALIPGPQAHAAKVAFEKYYLWKIKHGYVALP